MEFDPGLADAIDKFEADHTQKVADKAAARAAAAEARAAQGLTRSAEVMRARRARKDIRDAEHASANAKNTALRLLAEHHEDEYLALLQIERQKRGLPLFVPRNRASRPKMAPQVPAGASASTEPAPRPPLPSKDVLRAEKAPPAVLQPHTPEQQAQCPHNGGLRKLMYGTFCEVCGKKIR